MSKEAESLLINYNSKSHKASDKKPDKDGIYLTISLYRDRKTEIECGLLTSFCHFHDGEFWEKHNILKAYPDYWIEALDVRSSNLSLLEGLKKEIEEQMPAEFVADNKNDKYQVSYEISNTIVRDSIFAVLKLINQQISKL